MDILLFQQESETYTLDIPWQLVATWPAGLSDLIHLEASTTAVLPSFWLEEVYLERAVGGVYVGSEQEKKLVEVDDRWKLATRSQEDLQPNKLVFCIQYTDFQSEDSRPGNLRYHTARNLMAAEYPH